MLPKLITATAGGFDTQFDFDEVSSLKKIAEFLPEVFKEDDNGCLFFFSIA